MAPLLEKKQYQGIIVGMFVTIFRFLFIASSSIQTNQELERRVTALENRVTQLEKITQPAQNRTSSPTATGNKWRQLENGLTPDQVRRIFGEPDRVDSSGPMQMWYYGKAINGGRIDFYDGKVHGWSEPRS